eukprot:358796-Chlamydomonas_euryale.AAC.21
MSGCCRSDSESRITASPLPGAVHSRAVSLEWTLSRSLCPCDASADRTRSPRPENGRSCSRTARSTASIKQII